MVICSSVFVTFTSIIIYRKQLPQNCSNTHRYCRSYHFDFHSCKLDKEINIIYRQYRCSTKSFTCNGMTNYKLKLCDTSYDLWYCNSFGCFLIGVLQNKTFNGLFRGYQLFNVIIEGRVLEKNQENRCINKGLFGSTSD